MPDPFVETLNATLITVLCEQAMGASARRVLIEAVGIVTVLAVEQPRLYALIRRTLEGAMAVLEDGKPDAE